MTKKQNLEEIARQWRALPSDERKTEDQALSFSLKAMNQYEFHDYQEILGRLMEYTGLPN